MKKQTLDRLQELLSQDKLEFANSDDTGGVAVNYDMTDEELKELVELEYGQTQQDVLQLFEVICKNVIKIAMEQAKDEV